MAALLNAFDLPCYQAMLSFEGLDGNSPLPKRRNLSDAMSARWLIPQTLALLVMSALLAWLGIGVPLHFRAVSPLLLERAGLDTRSVEGMCADYVLAGKVGPVRLLWESCAEPGSELERARVRELLASRPEYWLSGGPAPYFEAFLGLLPSRPALDKESRVMTTILPAERRRVLVQYLGGSSSLVVQKLLSARELGGWRSFLPVSGPAGHPLDAALLSLALLAQGDNLHPSLARVLPELVDRAFAQDRAAQDRLEELLLAVLAAGRRMDWTQMTELFRCTASPEDASALIKLLLAEPQNFPTVYGALLLCGDYAKLGAYLEKYPDKGMVALKTSLPYGRGALDMLLEEGKELYEAPAFIRWLDGHLGGLRPGFLLDFTLHSPRPAFYLKVALVFGSGYALALAISRFLRILGVLTGLAYRRKRSLLALENIFVASAFTILLWMLAEPNLLRFSTENPARPVFEPAAVLATIIPDTNDMNANTLDQAAVLSLLLFFFLQLIVYVFCLMRISRLRAMDVPAVTKLKLLENEDNLFDLGLYVGLSGTVASLVMLAMNIVQASLVAAYASTLFGIIVTAVLKIVHIRALRRVLILEMQAPASSAKVASKEA